MKPIGEASRKVSPISIIIEELCVFFNTISGISRLQVNNKSLFDTPLILTNIRQPLIKPPDFLRRKKELLKASRHPSSARLRTGMAVDALCGKLRRTFDP
jgi:hypothetical protein